VFRRLQPGRPDRLPGLLLGRTPIVFLARSTAKQPSPSAYKPTELMPEGGYGGQYSGPDWNTNAVAVSDFDGTGHPDLFVGNYFPDSEVLNPQGIDNVQMPSSLSNAKNGGGDYIFRWLGGTSGPNPTVRYEQVQNAIPMTTQPAGRWVRLPPT